MKIEPQLVSCDHQTRDCSENDGGLKDKAASDAAEDHSSLGKAGHEVQQTRPAAEEWDEDYDEGGNSGHVLQLWTRPDDDAGHNMARVLQQHHTDIR